MEMRRTDNIFSLTIICLSAATGYIEAVWVVIFNAHKMDNVLDICNKDQVSPVNTDAFVNRFYSHLTEYLQKFHLQGKEK